MDVDRLMADERARWDELIAAFDAVPEDRFEEPGVTPDGWSPKDLLFHMVAWLDECTAVLERERLGIPHPQEDDTDEKNAEFFRTSQAMSAAEVRAALEPARARTHAAFAALEEITPNAFEWFEESGPIHYSDHERDIRGWLEGGP